MNVYTVSNIDTGGVDAYVDGEVVVVAFVLPCPLGPTKTFTPGPNSTSRAS